MSQFNNVSVVQKANIFFEGKCVSHTVHFADGTKKTVGVILPSTLTFNSGVPEIMETVVGSCRYRIKGGEWQSCGEGARFEVPGQSSFDIEVTEPYHYICHF